MRVCIGADPVAALSLRRLRQESGILSWIKRVAEIVYRSISLSA
jgi:hypothetical protein